MSQFDWKRPTCAMLGSFQPWTDEDTAVFKTIIKRTKQVVVWVQEADKGAKRPQDFIFVRDNIEEALSEECFDHQEDFIIQPVPYVTDMIDTASKDFRISQI